MSTTYALDQCTKLQSSHAYFELSRASSMEQFVQPPYIFSFQGCPRPGVTAFTCSSHCTCARAQRPVLFYGIPYSSTTKCPPNQDYIQHPNHVSFPTDYQHLVVNLPNSAIPSSPVDYRPIYCSTHTRIGRHSRSPATRTTSRRLAICILQIAV